MIAWFTDDIDYHDHDDYIVMLITVVSYTHWLHTIQPFMVRFGQTDGRTDRQADSRDG